MMINFYIREEYFRELYYLAMRLAEDFHDKSLDDATFYYGKALLSLYSFTRLNNDKLNKDSHLKYLEYTILRLDKMKKLMPVDDKER
jgi:hypothetical protein